MLTDRRDGAVCARIAHHAEALGDHDGHTAIGLQHPLIVDDRLRDGAEIYGFQDELSA